MITKLNENEIFVFGSNTTGHHGKGAAKQARNQLGAKQGVGEGLTGRCYALPTLNAYFRQRTEVELIESIREFYQCATDHPELTFLLTKVGCGLAGYDEEFIKGLFYAPVLFLQAPRPPTNIVWPDGWKRPTREERRKILDDLARAEVETGTYDGIPEDYEK